MGWAFKRSCNGAGGALQEICGAIAAAAGKGSGSDSRTVADAITCGAASGDMAVSGRRL
jgi:hypothetical protein